jgi:hypothetical protein
MMSIHQPTLPLQRAFVVQVHADAKVAQGEVWGRAEHIVSGQATHFQSLEELVHFIVRVLHEAGEDAPSCPC